MSLSRCLPRATVIRILLLVALLGTAAVAVPSPAALAGTTITVTQMTDEFNEASNNANDCSLREAVVAANEDRADGGCPAGDGADTIVVPAGTYTFAIPGDDFDDGGYTGDLDLTESVTIVGAGQVKTIIDADRLHRVFEIHNSADPDTRVIITRLTIRNGLIDSDEDDGGGIYNAGHLTMRSVVIEGNDAGRYGGGIYNDEDATRLIVSRAVIQDNGWTGIWSRSEIAGTVVLTITDSVVRNNYGGGIISENQTTIRRSTIVGNTSSGISTTASLFRIIDSTISGNTAVLGGGIAVGGVNTGLRVINSTISGNTASGSGGGIYHDVFSPDAGQIVLRNTTVVNNTANSGGGIVGVATLRNSIIADNTDTTGASPDCSSTLTSRGFNLIGDTTGCTITGNAKGNQLDVDPLLGPLADNGGRTETHALLPGSPAIDRGSWTCPATDQRGVARPQDGDNRWIARCDIGAYEVAANAER